MTAVTAYVGIGSNIDADKHINQALALLAARVGACIKSPVYKNPAQGFVGDEFLNLVIGFEFDQPIEDLRGILDDIECRCGRQRQTEKGMGARTMDLDLLLFGSLEGVYAGMRLPRPDIYNRQFVWQPLLDIFNSKDQLNKFERDLQARLQTIAQTTEAMRPLS